MIPQNQDSSPLSGSAKHALSVYVQSGRHAISLLESGLVDEAVAVLERRRFVLHNFRVHDLRLCASGLLTVEDGEDISRLGNEALEVDRDIELAISRSQAVLAEALADLGNRKKIGRYRSGQTDRPVVEREV